MTDILCFPCGFTIRILWANPAEMKFCPHCGSSNVYSVIAASDYGGRWGDIKVTNDKCT